MKLFRSLQLAASAPVARERLQILLEYERKLGSQIDLFTALREEILAVVSRHIVDPEKVQVTVDRGAKFSTLGVNIEIRNIGGTLPIGCPVLRVNKGQMMRGVDAAAGTLAVPTWFGGTAAAPFVGAILLGAGLIAAVLPGAGVYLQGTNRPGTVASLRRDPAAPAPVLQSAAVAPLAAPGSVTSPDEPPVQPAAELQSAAVTPPAGLGSAMSPPNEALPLRGSVIAPSQEPSPLRDPAAAAVTSSAALERATSLPHEPPPLRRGIPPPAAAADLVSQSAAVTPLASPGSITSPPQELPLTQSTAITLPASPGSITRLPARRFVTCNIRRTSIRSKWPWPSSKLSYGTLPCERFRVHGGGLEP